MLCVPTSEPVALREVDRSDLAPEIQSTLAALAEVEARYESDRECLEGWSGSNAIRLRLLDHLEARHRQERQPLVQQLAALYQYGARSGGGREPVLQVPNNPEPTS
jgi:hypothetical protein